MANKYVSLKNVKFILNKVHQANELSEYSYFDAYDEDSINMMIDTAKQFSDTYLFPFYEDMDRNEPDLVDGEIKVHESVKPLLAAMAEGGYIGASAPEQYGGMQMPSTLASALGFIMSAANNGAMGFTGLTAGAANLILAFAKEEYKEKFVPNMFAGKWQGTMALTEPQAGSSLSDITTSAKPMGDGTYKLTGQKVFISGGDYDAVDNIVHMTLARVEGAPKGTKGISLFIVPKHRIAENGDFTFNDVTTAGVYHKLGQKGTPAIHLMMGENDDCVGYLVGERIRDFPICSK